MLQWKRLAVLAALATFGCRAAPPAPTPERTVLHLGNLEISASLAGNGFDIFGSVDLMNTGSTPVRVNYDAACAAALLVLREPGDTVPIWDQERLLSAQPDLCVPTPVGFEIPGITLARILTPFTTRADVLGDSLLAGMYSTAVRLHLHSPRDTLLMLPAGPLDLTDEVQGPPPLYGLRRPEAEPGTADRAARARALDLAARP